MNCKPGDIAIIVRVGHPSMARNVGVWVRVVSKGEDRGHGPAWNVLTMSAAVDGWGMPIPPGTPARSEDAFLQPIRPPKPPEALPAPSVEREKETT